MAEKKKKKLILCAQCLTVQNPKVDIVDGQEEQTYMFVSDPDVEAVYILICPLCRVDLLGDIPIFIRYARRLHGNLMGRIEDLWPAGNEELISLVFSALIAGARELWRMNQMMPWTLEQKNQGEPTDT